MKNRFFSKATLVGLLALALTLVVGLSGSVAAEPTTFEGEPFDKEVVKKSFKKPGYSPYANRNFPTRVYWGDTHLHTALSLDARAFGVTLMPDIAYRLARGEQVTATWGEPIKLARPLDFLVVSDHSDAMGTMSEIIAGNPNLMTDPIVKDWHDRINQGGETALMATMEVILQLSEGKVPEVLMSRKLARSVWERYLKIAEEYNEPGRFTTLIGYEWTSTPDGNNLHRNVIYRDGADRAKRMLPFTAAQSMKPEDLWKWMQAYEDKTGGDLLAITHNGNLSNGLMFALTDSYGKALTKSYAETRIRWEPIAEVTQIKGDGETHPMLSPNDEFADYETWDRGSLTLTPKKPGMLQFEYARSALKNGLMLEQKLGVNPYKFGMVGSTDSHTSLATAQEDNFFGKHSGKEPKPGRWSGVVGEFEGKKILGWEQVSSGYAAVWATENTREALFDAMQRKEVYATTGSRILVRFFGGWDFQAEDANNRLPAAVGYKKGVPMGGDLRKAPKGKAPTFLVAALKDPLSGNLDRIQIIKGWLDAKRKTQEKVYDVVWGDADKRKLDAKGKVPPVGNTVDVKNAIWKNTIGDSELITVWKDPDFDPNQRAFYYARVIEIPTPRWTAYDAKRFKVKMDPKVPMTTRERAYTSPIWYTP